MYSLKLPNKTIQCTLFIFPIVAKKHTRLAFFFLISISSLFRFVQFSCSFFLLLLFCASNNKYFNYNYNIITPWIFTFYHIILQNSCVEWKTLELSCFFWRKKLFLFFFFWINQIKTLSVLILAFLRNDTVDSIGLIGQIQWHIK